MIRRLLAKLRVFKRLRAIERRLALAERPHTHAVMNPPQVTTSNEPTTVSHFT